MNLDKLVSGGMPPWQPCQAARDLEVWHRYDFPLTGTYKLNGDLILFTVIGDTSPSLSVWAYVPVPKSDRAAVAAAEFASPEEMQAFVEATFAGREAVFALARDLEIWKWTRFEVPLGEDGLVQAATDSLNEMVKWIKDNREPAPDVVFRATLAQAEVTTDAMVGV